MCRLFYCPKVMASANCVQLSLATIVHTSCELFLKQLRAFSIHIIAARANFAVLAMTQFRVDLRAPRRFAAMLLRCEDAP